MKFWRRRGNSAGDGDRAAPSTPAAPDTSTPVRSSAVRGIDDVQKVMDEFGAMKTSLSNLKQQLDFTISDLKKLESEHRKLQGDHNRLLGKAAKAYQTSQWMLMQSQKLAKDATEGLWNILSQEGMKEVVPRAGDDPAERDCWIEGDEPSSEIKPGRVTRVIMPGIISEKAKCIIPPVVLVSSGPPIRVDSISVKASASGGPIHAGSVDEVSSRSCDGASDTPPGASPETDRPSEQQ